MDYGELIVLKAKVRAAENYFMEHFKSCDDCNSDELCSHGEEVLKVYQDLYQEFLEYDLDSD